MMVIIRSISALIVAPIIINVDARLMSFLPRKHNNDRLPVKIMRPTTSATTRRIISDLRCGHLDDAGNNAVGNPAEKESGGPSQDIPDQISKRQDSAGGEGDEGRSDHERHGPWEEEIRRTRAFYGNPRLSSQTDDILITGTVDDADSGNANDIEMTGEDERVFGSAQIASYNTQDGEEEHCMESTTQSSETAEDDAAESDHDDTEGSEAVNQKSSEPSSELVVDLASQDAIDESESVNDDETPIQESADTSRRYEDHAPLDGNNNAEGEDSSSVGGEAPAIIDKMDSQLNVEEKYNAGRSSNVEVETKDSVGNEIEDLASVREDTVTMDKSDDELEVVLVGAEHEGIPLEEDYLDDTIVIQKISPIPNVDINEEDMRLAHNVWEKATKAAASNELVEEGLRRLQRRDGDNPPVAYVITGAMQRVLVDELGYDPSEVKAMRPDVAVVIVGESLERPDLESLPTQFYSYSDVEPDNVAIEKIADDKKTLQENVTAIFYRIRKKISTALVSRHPESTAIIVASLGVVLSLLFSSTHGKNSEVGTTQTFASEMPSSIVIHSNANSDLSDIEEDLYESDDGESTPSASGLQPDDLDKTWLDKLISFVSKPFGA